MRKCEQMFSGVFLLSKMLFDRLDVIDVKAIDVSNLRCSMVVFLDNDGVLRCFAVFDIY